MRFYHQNLELEVPDGVYYPREDSLLMAKAMENLDLQGKKCLDVGCGSGFLSIIMANKGAIVTATDINETTVEVAKKNAECNNVKIKFLRSDLFENIKGSFDFIVFNPPYLPVEGEDKHEDATYSGGKTGREIIERFLGEAEHHLRANGKIILLFSSLTGEKEVLAFAEKCGYMAQILEREKLDWEEIIVVELEGRNRQVF